MTLPTITPLPTAPSSSDPATFETRANAFVSALAGLQTEINAFGAAVPTEVGALTQAAAAPAGEAAGRDAVAAGVADVTRTHQMIATDLCEVIQGSGATIQQFGGFTWEPISGGFLEAVTSPSGAQPGVVRIKGAGTGGDGGRIWLGDNKIKLAAGHRFEAVLKVNGIVGIGAYIGFWSSDFTDAAYFSVSGGGMGRPTFLARTSKNNSFTNGTAVEVPDANAHYHVTITVAADGLSVTFGFYDLNGAEIANAQTFTTNLPVGETLSCGIQATAGSGAILSLLDIDYIAFGAASAFQRGKSLTVDPDWTSPIATSRSTASPNNTVNAVRMLAQANSTNADLVVQPRGTGALLAQLPDSGTAGGNKRGASAIDLQLSRSAAAQVASGANATIGGGLNNTASGASSVVAGGTTNIASGTSSAVAGGASNTASGTAATVAGGASNTVSGAYSAAPGGQGANDAGVSGTLAFGGAANGTRQTRDIILRNASTSATPVVLTTDAAAAGAGNQAVVRYAGSGVSCVHARITVTAATAGGAAKCWEGTCLVRTNGTATLIGSPTLTSTFGDAALSGCSVAVAIGSPNAIAITATGLAGTTINWSAHLQLLDQLA